MIQTQFSGRVRMKIDTTENWQKAVDFIPLKGEIIVYSDYATKEVDGQIINIPNYKVGDGLAYGIDLPFVNDDLRDAFSAHISNMNIHVTSAEKDFWNNKVRCYIETVEDDEGYLVDGENLIFTTN